VGHDTGNSAGRRVINEPFVVINADDFYEPKAIACWRSICSPAGRSMPWPDLSCRNYAVGVWDGGARCVPGEQRRLPGGVVEMTKIARDGSHAKNIEANAQRPGWRQRSGLDEYVGIYAANLCATGRTFHKIP